MTQTTPPAAPMPEPRKPWNVDEHSFEPSEDVIKSALAAFKNRDKITCVHTAHLAKAASLWLNTRATPEPAAPMPELSNAIERLKLWRNDPERDLDSDDVITILEYFETNATPETAASDEYHLSSAEKTVFRKALRNSVTPAKAAPKTYHGPIPSTDDIKRFIANVSPESEFPAYAISALVDMTNICAMIDNGEICTTPATEPAGGDAGEVAYWNFDARRSGYGHWKGTPQSERDAFKAEYAKALASGQSAAVVPQGFVNSAYTILENMAKENPEQIAFAFERWPINHEPLRADAKAFLERYPKAAPEAKE